MKSFQQLREQTEQLSELSAFNDPPTILVLRRTAIRLFPGNQRVANYRNDNLDLEIAIPYNPDTLGKKKIMTSVANEDVALDDFDKADLIIQIDEGFKEGDKVEIHRLYGLQLKKPITGHIKHDLGKSMYHVSTNHSGTSTVHDLTFEKGTHAAHRSNMTFAEEVDLIIESTSDNLFGMYLKHHSTPIHFNDRKFKPLKKIEAVVAQRYGHSALKHFQAAAAHTHAGDFDRANHHYAKYKAAADQLGESLDEETLMEAGIHALHAITRTKTPAKVHFQNGAALMVHHETAAHIMKLHSQMKAANKRKIEAMVNSSPEGLKKVHDFAKTHMK